MIPQYNQLITVNYQQYPSSPSPPAAETRPVFAAGSKRQQDGHSGLAAAMR